MTELEKYQIKLMEVAQLFMEWLEDTAKKTGFSEDELQAMIKQFLT